MELSVIIRTTGTVNKLLLLEKLLKSLSNQTIKDFELIIVCESNSDAIKEIVAKYFNNFKVIESGYWNRCKTTNMGIKLASSRYIILLDDDYIMNKEWLEIMLSAIKRAPKDIACIGSGCESVFREALKYRYFIARVFEVLSLSSLWMKKRSFIDGLIITIVFGGTHAICRREALLKVGGYDEELNEPLIGDDLGLALKLWREGYKNAIFPIAKVYHLEKYVSKQVSKNISYYESAVYSEIYTCTKYFDIVSFYIFNEIIYRVLWGLVYSFRSRNPRITIHVFRGVLMGFIHGFLRYKNYHGVSKQRYTV
jgi:GT2 family glycosyltransferase